MAKKEAINQSTQYRINDQIRVPEIRLVGDSFEAISRVAGKDIEAGVFPTRTARTWAEQLELDLVEISPNAIPPVCKITDFNKFLYQKRKKEKEIKANTVKTILKEIRFSPHTDAHDFEFKTRHAQKFLLENSKVKAYVTFKGREIVFKEQGELLLLKFLKELEDCGVPDSLPRLEGRRMSVVISPKKASGKK